jgi:putative FmdB family regulatory protein
LPLYEYGCPTCGSVADVRHGFDDRPDVTCEKCGAAMTRRFSAAPIVFKGSGFYVTDSRSGGKSEKTQSPKSESSEKSDKPATTETKAETKSEPSKGSDAAA